MARKSTAAAPNGKKSANSKAAPRSKGRQPDRGLELRVILLILLLLGVVAVVAWAGGDSGPAALWLSDMSKRPADRAALDGRRIGVISGHSGFDFGGDLRRRPAGGGDGGRHQPARGAPPAPGRRAGRSAGRIRRRGSTATRPTRWCRSTPTRASSAAASRSARWADSPMPAVEDRLVRCLSERYAAATGLPFDADTITEDMTAYHAFRKLALQTPGAIIETGYLGGDWDLIGRRPAVAADGIVDGLVCFLGH